MEETQKRITVSLSEECYEALRRYAFDENTSLSSALKRLCEEGLERREYGAMKNNRFIRVVKR